MSRFNLKIFKTSELSFVLMGIGLLALIMLFVVLVPGNRKAEDNNRIMVLEAKLEQLEDRLVKCEGIDERLVRLETQGKNNQLIKSRLDRLESSFLKIANITKKLDNLQKRRVEVEPTKAVEPESAAVSKEATKERYHKVQAGDTLYNISRRYGVTVNALRRLNNLGPEEKTLQIGQKLLISQEKGR